MNSVVRTKGWEMHMARQYLLIGCVLGLLLTLACTNGQAKAKKDSAKDEKIEAVPVEVVQPFRARMEATLNLTATAYSEDQVPVFSETTGIVEGAPLEEGTPVRRGQVLARLKRQELELALKMAQSTFDKTKADFQRTKSLFDSHLVSQDAFDQAQYTFEQARIARDQAKVNLDKAVITAPIDGVVSERLIRKGDLVKPQQQLFTLVNLDTLKANLFVPEKNIRSVSVKSPVRVKSDAFPDRGFEGVVERIAPVADPNSGTFKVTVALNNHGRLLRPGMFLSTSVVVDTHENALVIPKKSLVYETEDKPKVFVVKDGKAQELPVVPGLTDLMNVEIVKGLAPKDRVVTVGQSGLKDGVPVKVLPKEGSGAPAAVALGS
jgi:membrane fusion protein, multidrug efflux system